MDPNRDKMLKELMAADFMLIELNLYLDTHPCDQNALSLYNTCTQKAKVIRENYEKNYGPVTPTSPSRFPWQWIESPWPWEKQ